MNKKELDYLFFIASLELSANEYRVLLLLLTKSNNQAGLMELLRVKRQSVNITVKGLESKNLIEVERQEGRNKYYRPVTDLERLQTMLPGQTRIDL